MNENLLYDAISHIDDGYIAEYCALPEKAAEGNRKARPGRMRWGAAAACLCAGIVCAAVFLPGLLRDGRTLPSYGNAYLSAEEVSKVFPTADDGAATTSYIKQYLPKDKAPAVNPLPTEQYAKIYKLQPLSKPLDRSELSALSARILPGLTAALGVDMDAFEKTETRNSGSLSESNTMNHNGNNWFLNFSQSLGGYKEGYSHAFSMNSFYMRTGSDPIVLNGKTVQIDQRQSEEEILSSLAWVRETLFAIFGCTFDSQKIVLDYGAYRAFGAENIYVYYYNRADSDMMGDHIELWFDNFLNYAGEEESPDVIRKCKITYLTYRIPPEAYFTEEASCRLLSLEEAEALLAKGYVFGGHSCSLCMAMQQQVTFDSYDYVSYRYLTDRSSRNGRSLPFFTFYKRIGTAPNGNTVYGVTNVCAIEVSGMEDYFAGQRAKHPKLPATEPLP